MSCNTFSYTAGEYRVVQFAVVLVRHIVANSSHLSRGAARRELIKRALFNTRIAAAGIDHASPSDRPYKAAETFAGLAYFCR